jgi:hypothetical protein
MHTNVTLAHIIYIKKVTSIRIYKTIMMFYTAFRHPSCSGVICMAEISIVNILVIVHVMVEYYNVQTRVVTSGII